MKIKDFIISDNWLIKQTCNGIVLKKCSDLQPIVYIYTNVQWQLVC